MANPNEPGLNGTPWVVRQLWEQVLVIWHLVMASSGFKALVFSTCQQFEECYWIQMIHRSPSAIQLYQLYPLLRYNKILYVRIKSFFLILSTLITYCLPGTRWHIFRSNPFCQRLMTYWAGNSFNPLSIEHCLIDLAGRGWERLGPAMVAGS